MIDFNQKEPNEAAQFGFRGQGWSFPTVFAAMGGTLRLEMVAAEADIRQSLYLLFHTEPGDRNRRFFFQTDTIAARWNAQPRAFGPQ